MDNLAHSTSIAPRATATVDVLGIRIAPMTLSQMVDLIGAHIFTRERCVISSVNLHGLYIYKRDASFRDMNRRSFPRIDGMSIVWLARLLGQPVERRHRVAWLDLIEPLLSAAADRRWRLYYLGSKAEVIRDGIAEIRRRYPSLAIDGHHGYVQHDLIEGVRKRIRAFAPDMLIVGMGMPIQEQWVLDNADKLDVPVIATSGACIEYIARAAKTPPRWLGQYGVEWVYRLATNPRRFWLRYLVGKRNSFPT
jgi:N-acetylglucosaminyldiphosphoundecaprenol N-acetyl-beta-D-mannosaminyltransferase